jgi:hypothetical protein
MPKRLRLTRRPNIAMTEDGYRRLRKLAGEAGSTKGSSSPSSSSTGAAW